MPVARDIESKFRECVASDRIAGGRCMLTAIDLDDEPFFEADEIENVAFERRLAAKLEVRELSGSQQPPHRGFGVGRSVTHLFCEDA